MTEQIVSYQGSLVPISELPGESRFDLRVDHFGGRPIKILRDLSKSELLQNYDPLAQTHYVALSGDRR